MLVLLPLNISTNYRKVKIAFTAFHQCKSFFSEKFLHRGILMNIHDAICGFRVRENEKLLLGDDIQLPTK